MAIAAGARIGPYEVLSLLGAGGMGEVYRARDTTLHRDVAIKVLPDLFASDAERLTRFTREAQTLAALNHPNIAHIHGLEASGGVRALVMELVEGEDLSQRIARGVLPLDEALPIARQIAEALETAHEQGIIHRDLKPANVKLRADGVAKVLDFGLAKALEPGAGDGDSGASHLANSPTITSPAMTMRGMILGTAAYMAPEQAKGKPVDKRADIWAFGCVLYEMLTGRRAFAGDDVSTTLAAVLLKDPDWQAVPGSTPVALRRLLTSCLKKDPKARLRDIGEARLRIDELLGGASDDAGAPIVTPAESGWRRVVPWAAAVVLALGSMLIGAAVARRSAREVTSGAVPMTFTIAPPENTSFGGPAGGGTGTATQVAVSPDGRNIAFVAGAQSAYQIYLRPIASPATRAIPGTDGGTFPFWSPDSRFIGFFADGKLKKVQLGGDGLPIVLCDAPFGRGGSWSRDNVILFAPGEIANAKGRGMRESLWRVSSAGGVPAIVTSVDPANADTRHRWPHFLPDGRHFIYTEVFGPAGAGAKPSTIKVGSLEPSEAHVTLLQAESSAAYASGHVLFARDETLMAQPFDPETRQFAGGAFPVAERVSQEASRYMGASVSENGTLVYGSVDSLAVSELTWRDRTGRVLGSVGGPAPYLDLALSPEERRVAVAVGTGDREKVDIWIVDIARNVRSRLTVDPGVHAKPVWSPDGTQVAYSSSRSGKTSLHVKRVGGTSPEESLVEGAGNTVGISVGTAPSSWSADGRFIAYTVRGAFPRTSDVWILPLFGERKPFPLVHTNFLEGEAVFSPDGRSIAYTTNDSGQPNVFVQSFPDAGEKLQVSTAGGNAPMWRADGKGLYYLGLDSTLMAVAIDTTGRVDAGPPQALFPTGMVNSGFTVQTASPGLSYAVAKDGQRFLFNARTPRSAGVPPLNVVVNWMAAIQR